MTRNLKTGKTTTESDKQFEKFDVTDDQKSDEREDEFIVKMILKPVNRAQNEINSLDRPTDSKLSKILKRTEKNSKKKKL